MRTIHGVAAFRKTACTTSPFVTIIAIVCPAPPGICSTSRTLQVKPILFEGTFERRCAGLQAELKLWGTVGGHGCNGQETVEGRPCPGCDCTSPMKLTCLFPVFRRPVSGLSGYVRIIEIVWKRNLNRTMANDLDVVKRVDGVT